MCVLSLAQFISFEIWLSRIALIRFVYRTYTCTHTLTIMRAGLCSIKVKHTTKSAEFARRNQAWSESWAQWVTVFEMRMYSIYKKQDFKCIRFYVIYTLAERKHLYCVYLNNFKQSCNYKWLIRRRKYCYHSSLEWVCYNANKPIDL